MNRLMSPRPASSSFFICAAVKWHSAPRAASDSAQQRLELVASPDSGSGTEKQTSDQTVLCSHAATAGAVVQRDFLTILFAGSLQSFVSFLVVLRTVAPAKPVAIIVPTSDQRSDVEVERHGHGLTDSRLIEVDLARRNGSVPVRQLCSCFALYWPDRFTGPYGRQQRIAGMIVDRRPLSPSFSSSAMTPFVLSHCSIPLACTNCRDSSRHWGASKIGLSSAFGQPGRLQQQIPVIARTKLSGWLCLVDEQFGKSSTLVFGQPQALVEMNYEPIDGRPKRGTNSARADTLSNRVSLLARSGFA